MQLSNDMKKRLDVIKEQIDNTKEKKKDISKLVLKDIANLKNDVELVVTCKEGCDLPITVYIRRKYTVTPVLNIPVLMYYCDEYFVEDMLGMQCTWNAQDTLEYVQGLFGYGDEDTDEEVRCSVCRQEISKDGETYYCIVCGSAICDIHMSEHDPEICESCWEDNSEEEE